MIELEIQPLGPFSLAAAASFGFGPTEGLAAGFDGVFRLAFPADGGGYAAAALRQAEPDGVLSVELHGDAGPDAALAQIARILSLDYDGDEWMHVGERDPVIGALQRAHPGQRPVLFHSPYEAAAWATISSRRPARVAASVLAELSAGLGRGFELAGQELLAFPQPDRLLGVEPRPGLETARVERLRGVAAAAADGLLDAGRLRELGPERAFTEVTQLKGIGPFYGSLIVVRATGFADALLPVAEPRVLGHAARFYGLTEPPTQDEFARIADAWRPFRTWATVLLRLAGQRGTPL